MNVALSGNDSGKLLTRICPCHQAV